MSEAESFDVVIIGPASTAFAAALRAQELPPHYQAAFPWRLTLVPLSGEATTDESLTTALQLAQRLDLNVAIAHAGPARPGTSAMPGRYVDQVHHEFAQMPNQLVASACPMCSAEERARIEAFHLTQGEVGDELIRLVEEKGVGLLVLGWHGRFMIGHAQVLKRLIGQVRSPILLGETGAQAAVPAQGGGGI